MKYKRVLLKISGEALLGSQNFGIVESACREVASKVATLSEAGHEVGIVIGGGNIFRGIQQGPSLGLSRTPADQIGILATLINGVALEQALLAIGYDVRLISAIDCPTIAEKYEWRQAMRHLSCGRILLFVGGTGHPFFTTDTAAALRASEIGADLFLKATTRVDGVYDKDPLVYKDANKYDRISYSEVLEQKLGIIDLTAIALCMQSHIPVRVFNFLTHPLLDAVSDRPCGTLVGGE